MEKYQLTWRSGLLAGLANSANPVQTLSALVGLILLSSCGGITLGGGTLNDPVPTSGSIIATGSFIGQNGRAVTGSVSVYKQLNSSCNGTTYVLRLESLSAPTDVSLVVIPVVNGATAPPITPSFFSLRGATGSQNYTFTGADCNTSWAQVLISGDASGSTNSAQNYGVANLNRI